MKKLPCSYDKCHLYRIHHERQDTPRGIQYIEVPDDYVGKAFCSFTCALLAGAMSLKNEDKGKK